MSKKGTERNVDKWFVAMVRKIYEESYAPQRDRVTKSRE
jgi:hypothetical protein